MDAVKRQLEDSEGSSQSEPGSPAKRPKIKQESQEWHKSQEVAAQPHQAQPGTPSTPPLQQILPELPASFTATPRPRFVELPAVSVLIPDSKDSKQDESLGTRSTPPPIEELAAQAQQE